MKIITFIKRLFRKGKKYQVWDTSALSNHFESFKNTLKARDGATVVIPEGVSHEISVGRRNNENCKEIYKFIEGNIRNPRLILAVTPDSIRSWAVDEQVIYTAQRYNERGFSTTLITCDRDQSFRAKLKHLEVRLIPAKKAMIISENTIKEEQKTDNVPLVIPTVVEESMATNVEEETEIDLPARMIGKQCWLNWNKNVAVYDSKGKRKIFRPDGMAISSDDIVYYKERAYAIKSIAANKVTVVRT